MQELHQKLSKKGLFQIQGIKNKKEIFDPQYKTCRDKTLTGEHKEKLLLLDKKLISKN